LGIPFSFSHIEEKIEIREKIYRTFFENEKTRFFFKNMANPKHNFGLAIIYAVYTFSLRFLKILLFTNVFQ